MREEKSFDLKILEDKELFTNISNQKDLFVQMFSELGNEFPISKIKRVHSKAKGSKISKGNQLEDCPYQVLDLIRDFDPVSGLNIRILNWWGHGILVLILYGTESAFHYQTAISKLLREYNLTKMKSPWDYESLFASDEIDNSTLENHISKFGHLQLIKVGDISESYQETLKTLKLEIEHIIDIHLDNLT